MPKVYTSQYQYEGKDRCDITVKSGFLFLAPTWNMVLDYKNGKINEEEYTKLYYDKMRQSYKSHRAGWDWLLNKDIVTLVCFCKPGDFCHRLLLAEMLIKLGATYLGEK